MSFKIDNIVTSLKRTLTDYKIIEGNRSVFFLEEPNSRTRGARDNRVISIHSDSGVEYGKLFYQITMSRNRSIKLKQLYTFKFTSSCIIQPLLLRGC